MSIPKYTLHVRDLLDITETKLWKLKVPGLVDLTFDDGEVVYNADTVDVLISWYYWKIAYYYRDLSITTNMFLNGKRYTDNTHKELLEAAIDETIDRDDIDKEHVWHIGYREIYNKLYNVIVERMLPYVGTMNVPEILEILFDEEVFKSNNNIKNSLKSCNDAHTLLREMWENEKYPDNPSTQSYLNHTVSPAQLYQSYGPRGQTTNIDSEIYGNVITRGFAQSFIKINDLCKESRSAAKALLFNKDPVAAAEYFNRKLQFVCAKIRRVVKGDCGTHDYHEVQIDDDAAGKALFKSIVGLYQILDDDTIQEIRASDKHLIGTRVRFRTTLCCSHLPKQVVCEKCYGKASYSLPWDTNPGHVSSTAICKLITQLIISTKHLDFIVHKFKAWLNKRERFYLETHKGVDDLLFLNHERKHVYMRFSALEASEIVKINYLSSLKAIPLTTISSLSNVTFYMKDADGTFCAMDSYCLIKNAIQPSLSQPLLEYMKEYGWTTIDKQYMVDLSKWDNEKPLLVYPLKNDNMSDYHKRVERHIRSNKSAGAEESAITHNNFSKLSSYDDVTAALLDTHRMIEEKLSGVHLGHIATVLAASRCAEPDAGNYTMPESMEYGKFENHDDIIRGSSLGVAMFYKDQAKILNSLEAFVFKRRDSSVMDNAIYLPYEIK